MKNRTSAQPQVASANRREAALLVAGRPVTITVRRSLRARRVALRLHPAGDGAELVVPRGMAYESALAFARDRTGWLARQLDTLPPRVPFAPGATISVAGEPLVIRHSPDRSGPVRREGGEILVSGAPEHVARRVRDWLKAEARALLGARSRQFAARLGRRVASLRLADPATRWGSCGPDGGLSYSWRLILAPPAVLDYVVAHEVAHLAELNHGGRFWRLVAELVDDVDSPRAWLRRHGLALLRHG